ncbi:phytanoyl-CoA dioxygenase PhyH [Algoriphagus boseongensis]|uniref:Phytanoyl-CoA dioxygenase PhyH n=1 Tax=Algoriphagus boseongensis TaxID=1442587 RepID=A0A4R6T9F7_9BACT|nr:phytanoyl-CoA dioxygenase family protein [Algoriphagus boseongensis]TDQ19391.1 phytanoyl-CoA dioxygenase PhyH [Algoriphagus boseongensis]
MAKFSAQEVSTQKIDQDHLMELLKDFRKDGFLILENAFKPELIKNLHKSFLSNNEKYFFEEKNEDRVHMVGDKRFQITVEVEGVFNDPNFFANPLIFPIVQNLLDADLVIESITCVTSLPGAKPMGIHCDGTVFNNVPKALLPPHAVGLLIPLIPFNHQNGVTRIWPGSHKRELEEVKFSDNKEFIDPELNLGACILMDYRLIHQGNGNNSDQLRPLLYCNYCAPWYIDQPNFIGKTHLILNDKNYELISEDFRRLFLRRNLKLS